MKLNKQSKYSYPSGLGGRFDVKYIGYDKNRKVYKFKVLNPGFETMELTLGPKDLWELREETPQSGRF